MAEPTVEKNLWILSEERPKVEVLEQILKLVIGEKQKIDNIRPLFQDFCCYSINDI